jgi:hypothetical protein
MGSSCRLRQRTNQELQHPQNALPGSVSLQPVEEWLSTLGNVVACNDHVALVHPDVDRETEEIIVDVLKVSLVWLRQRWGRCGHTPQAAALLEVLRPLHAERRSQLGMHEKRASLTRSLRQFARGRAPLSSICGKRGLSLVFVFKSCEKLEMEWSGPCGSVGPAVRSRQS